MLCRFRLGVFDPPERLPWADLGPADVGSRAKEQLALEAARKGVPHVMPYQIGEEWLTLSHETHYILQCADHVCLHSMVSLRGIVTGETLSLHTLQSARWPVTL